MVVAFPFSTYFRGYSDSSNPNSGFSPFNADNICEASNFYPLWIMALLMMLFAKWRRGLAVPPLILSLAALIVVIGAYCVIPMPQWLARGSLLGFAVEERSLLGIGMANILLSCLFFDSYREPILKRSGITALTVTAGCFTAGILWLHPFPADSRLSTVIVLINCAIVGMFIWDRAKTWFLAVFTTLVFLNGAAVNPVMRGLSPLLESQTFKQIDKLRQASFKRQLDGLRRREIAAVGQSDRRMRP